MKDHKDECKFCSTILTKENRYGKNICIDKNCVMKHIRVCSDDCFNCSYSDCIADPHKLGSYQDERLYNGFMRKNKNKDKIASLGV